MKYRITIDNNYRALAFEFDNPNDALNFANVALMHVENGFGIPNAKYEIIDEAEDAETANTEKEETGEE